MLLIVLNAEPLHKSVNSSQILMDISTIHCSPPASAGTGGKGSKPGKSNGGKAKLSPEERARMVESIAAVSRQAALQAEAEHPRRSGAAAAASAAAPPVLPKEPL